MQWTSNPPTEAGWYWMRVDGYAQCVEVMAYFGRMVVYQSGVDGGSEMSELLGAEWYGPTLPPTEG